MIKKDELPEEMPSQDFESAMGKTEVDESLLPSPDDVQILHEQIEMLTQSLEETKAKAEKADLYWDRLLHKEADLQNIQKRAAQDIENARKLAVERFATQLLDVIDSLEQGLNHAQTSDAASNKDIIEGMRLTHSQLLNIFDKEHIRVIDPLNETFDPKFHEAISIQETSEVEPNKIIMVVQKGYILHQRLLRPARVVVSKAPALEKD